MEWAGRRATKTVYEVQTNREGLEPPNNGAPITSHASRRFAYWGGSERQERVENERNYSPSAGVLARDRHGKMFVGDATSGAEFTGYERAAESPVVGAGL